MVQLWDDLFALCERHGLRILLTPFDTFWTWLHWQHHPYNRATAAASTAPTRILLCPETRAAIKGAPHLRRRALGRQRRAVRLGPVERDPPGAGGGRACECFGEFIHDLSSMCAALEQRLYGRSHPQTVSLFGPELWWRPHLPLQEPIFRHPDLDFATIHIYQRRHHRRSPQDTVDAGARHGARSCAQALAEIRDARPFLDTEHGPIHTYKDKQRTLPEAFDDEYFRHMQWAHLASGGGRRRHALAEPHAA